MREGLVGSQVFLPYQAITRLALWCLWGLHEKLGFLNQFFSHEALPFSAHNVRKGQGKESEILLLSFGYETTLPQGVTGL